MFKIKDDVRTFCVIILVCIICIILGVFLSHKSNYDKLKTVDEYNVYFSNISYINNFINNIARKNTGYVYDLLDYKFIDDNNIDVSNVLEYFGDYSIQDSFDADNMFFVQIKDDFIYYIEGKIYENGFDTERKLVDDDFSVVISIDNENKCYSIYPVDSEYKTVINGIKNVNVSTNSNNYIKKSDTINKEQVCAIYLSDFTNTLFNSYEEAYDLLSKDMKKKYVDVYQFKDFIIDKLILISTTADKCRMDMIKDKRVYTVIDDNENYYVFTEDSIMKYVVEFYLKEVDK